MNEEGQQKSTSSTGMDSNIAGLLCYVLGWVTGLIFILIEKEDKSVRFHAAQSILVSAAFTAFYILLNIFLFAIPALWSLFMLLYSVLGLGGLILWIMLMVKAYQGDQWKLPVIGDLAESWA